MNGKKKIIGKKFNGAAGTEFADPIARVKTCFDGLGEVVENLPEGKDKTTLQRWVGDAYMTASKTIYTLLGNKASIPA